MNKVLKTLLVAVIAVAICAAAIFALYRWPQPKAREGGLAVLAAVQRARRLCSKALSRLTRSAYKVPEGKKAPSRDEVTLREEMALDEGALGVLREAQDELADVLAKNGHAEEGALALGHATIGRILSLRAKFHAEMAAKAWQKARDARNKAYDVSAKMGSLGVKARYFNRLASLTTDAVAAESEAAKKRQKELQAEIETIDGQIKDKEKTHAALLEANAKLSKEAEQLNTASQLAIKAKESLDKFEQAQVREKQITKGRLALDKIENEIRDLKAKRADLAIELKNAEARATVADAIIADRKKLKGEHEAEVTGEKEKLAKTKGEVEALATEALKACQEAAEACKKAMPLYGEAEKSLKQSVGLQPSQPRQRKAEALAALGDLVLAWAQLHARQLADHHENELCVQAVEKAWVDPADLDAGAPGSSTPVTLPEVLRNLRGFLKQSGQVRDTAKAKYQQAVDIYKEAMTSVSERHLVWAYQGQLARAYLRLYELSGRKDTASLNEAKQLLRDATQGRENAPFIKPLAQELESLK